MTLQLAFLPELERRKPAGDREAGERHEHEPDVEDEHDVAPCGSRGLLRPARRIRDRQQRCGERHHTEPEQPVPGTAAPDQVCAHHEPDEEVERPGPRAPRKAVGIRRLDDEQRRLREPSEPDAPRREPAERARASGVPGVGDRSLPVGDQGRPDEELSHLAPPGPAPAPRATRARAPAVPP